MAAESTVYQRFNATPTLWQRMCLRLIGIGVVMLCDRPIYALARYWGLLGKLGSWALTENGKVTGQEAPADGA